jgi:hypothetical protein
MSSNRRSKQVGNINYAPDFIKALDNSASKIAGCYGFATTASLHKIYSTDPSFQHCRDVIDTCVSWMGDLGGPRAGPQSKYLPISTANFLPAIFMHMSCKNDQSSLIV